jgi:predicted P-loop ATPase
MTTAPTDDPKVVNLKRKKAGSSKQAGWRGQLILNDNGNPKTCLANAIDALRSAPEWDGVLWHDEFSVRTVARHPPPWDAAAINHLGADWRECEWTDRDDILTANWLQQQGINVSKDVAAQAIEAVAHDRRFHPVRDYLDSLRWDGTPRLPYWLTTYLGVPKTPYSAAVGTRWLVAAVARIDRPGCKADCALILEGPQGLKKSTALSVLGGPWFTDQIADLGSKDSCVDVQGAWIIELAELDSMSRPALGRIKAFMSRPADRFRPPYGKRTVNQPRQCIFAGTINPEGGYLKDATGNRRFWPVTCTDIDVEALERDVDQLWAEAVALYCNDMPWWLDTPELEQAARRQQEARYQGDAWDDPIQRYLTHYKAAVRNDWGDVTGFVWTERAAPLDRVSVGEILAEVFELPEAKWSQVEQNRVSRALTALGWQRKQRQVDGQKVWVYVRPPSPVQQSGDESGDVETCRNSGTSPVSPVSPLDPHKPPGTAGVDTENTPQNIDVSATSLQRSGGDTGDTGDIRCEGQRDERVSCHHFMSPVQQSGDAASQAAVPAEEEREPVTLPDIEVDIEEVEP